MSAAVSPAPTWFGQPRGLTVLFLTNMWEQFSYYGMRALLVYYMTKQLMLGQAHASLIYGAYTACAYFTPIFGGVIADRLLGKRRAIVLGGTIMALGHFLMAFEPLFYVALVTIALGNGLFLPSLPSQIDDLYAPGDPRVGWAYNVYYVGVNIGGFLAPVLCGTLGELYGWHYGFGAAGVGMVAGLGIYLWGQRYLPASARAAPVRHATPRGRFTREVALLLVAVALCVTVFRAAYEQVGNTVALWADSGVDRRAGDAIVPMTWFQSLNPLFVMAMTPPLLARWRRRAERGGAERPVRRMAVGALIAASAYLLLATLAARHNPSHWLWLALFFALLTVGELHILPTGLGLFARLAPAGLGATTVAAWYLATFAGSLAAGLVGTAWTALGHGAFFLLLAGLAALAAALLAAIDAGSVAVISAGERR
ncbi:POT family proton-dependent oligopeptide transporter [Sphingomonas endophytica]|uniref:POT family proton-dependent oligopeptide transporter n=1 Tax=Sphingomonas endophytica TaxID=869719 RepID=A0A7X0JC97_9SPHN|nr:peptide MFS transporter [Sphingomonas endophytica]MBB6504585.1 POT family proton-dependent oligopeptide transporter [Sphingomonas endophytica]